MRSILFFILLSFTSSAVTVNEGTLSLLTNSSQLDPANIITAGSVWDGGAGSSSDGVRVTSNGIDFGDTYTPTNPSFTGSINGGIQYGSAPTGPNLGDAALNEVLRTQGWANAPAIDFTLPNGVYKVQLLFWEPYYGVQTGGGIGSRIFSFSVEGSPAVTELDLAAYHGVSSTTQAVLYTITVPVTDGSLNIDFTPVVDNATLAGIIISQPSVPLITGPHDLVGIENFTLSDGTIAGKNSGYYFDYNNIAAAPSPTPHLGASSYWANVDAAPTIVSNALVTNNSSARRNHSGTPETNGTFSETSRNKVIYYRFNMKRGSNASWSGLSAYDGSTERILFGVPTVANPASGNRELGIHVLNSSTYDGYAYSGISASTYSNTDMILVGKIDYANHLLSLYLNPNLSQPEASNTPIATRAYTAPHTSTALRLGSGGTNTNSTGNTTWDNVVAATTWSALSAGPYRINTDEVTLRTSAAARILPLKNDLGTFDASTLTILSMPTHGTATVNVTDGSITYTHNGDSATSDSITYSVSGVSAVISISITNQYRFTSNLSQFPNAAPATGYALENAFTGITFDSPHDLASSGNTIFVTEGDGKVWLIPDVTSPTKTLFLDITANIEHDNNELALKGITAHPNYDTNGYIYVTYNAIVGANRYVRLSRFTRSTGNPLTADAASELILINQLNNGTYHNIGVPRFGPDGYLYVGFGDEGTQDDSYANSQRIDKDLWSCIIRIDPDKNAGNLAPNSDSDIPGSTTGNANFSIPADNPFVGATSFNGVSVTPANVRTELYAVGLRNPWQFRFDSVSGALYAGDVGRNDREEIDLITSGGNYGWAWQEGNIAGIRTGQLINGAAESAATITAPIYTYDRVSGVLSGQSVTGGIVYRGTRFPNITGKYIFCDYVSGNVWSMDPSNPTNIAHIATENSIVSLIADPSNGDVLLLDRGTNGASPNGAGRILRLVQTAEDTTFPATLSATNFFSNLSTLTANPGAYPYDVNLRFWSDNAEKQRWFLNPSASAQVGYSLNDPWTIPSGMVFVKHFDIELTPGDAATKRKLETRFLIKTDSGSYGVSYKWNHITDGQAQTEATLVGTSGETLALPNQTWEIPSRGQCSTCHNAAAGDVLSFNTRQLNLSSPTIGDQLSFLSAQAFINTSLAASSTLPRHVRPDENTYSLEARARSYLDVNCSYCHRPGGGGGGVFDVRHHLTIGQTGIINTAPLDAPLHTGDLLVTPCVANTSIIYNRAAAANGYSRMPPIGSNVIDTVGTTMLADWINSGSSTLKNYDAFRMQYFGNLSSANGNPTANPDGDMYSNYDEYLLLTNPTSSTSFSNNSLTKSGSNFTLPFLALQSRKVLLYHSSDLINWSLYPTTLNAGIPLNPDLLPSVTIPITQQRDFFRFQVEEN